MSYEIITAIILSIAAVIGGMVLNFHEFLMGSPATVKNVVVTVAYIAIWILISRIGVKYKNRGFIKYCSIFWIITFFFAIVIMFVNTTGALAVWALLPIILLLGQWYGITFFIRGFLIESIIIAFISLAASIILLIALKRTKSI